MKKGFLFGLGILLSGVVLAAGIGVDDIDGAGGGAIPDKAETDTVSHNEFNAIIGALRNIFNLDGKIGIGTSEPGAKLELKATQTESSGGIPQLLINTEDLDETLGASFMRPIFKVSGKVFNGQEIRNFISLSPSAFAMYPTLASYTGLVSITTTGSSSFNVVNELGEKLGVAIGSALPNTGGDRRLLLDVEGAMGATHYCDEEGNNCVAAADLASGGGGAVPDAPVPGSTVCEFTGTAQVAGTGEFYHEWIEANCTDGLPQASCTGVLTQASHAGSDQDWMVINPGGDNKPGWPEITATAFTSGGIAWTNATGAADGAKRIQATYFCGGAVGGGGGALSFKLISGGTNETCQVQCTNIGMQCAVGYMQDTTLYSQGAEVTRWPRHCNETEPEPLHHNDCLCYSGGSSAVGGAVPAASGGSGAWVPSSQEYTLTGVNDVWTDNVLDLSGVVGAQETLVYLKATSSKTDNWSHVYVRTPGESEAFLGYHNISIGTHAGAGASGGQLGDDSFVYLTAVTDANGKLEVRTRSGANNNTNLQDITFRLMGYIGQGSGGSAPAAGGSGGAVAAGPYFSWTQAGGISASSGISSVEREG